jgi:predicted aconitase with swiveling domain
VLVLDEPVSFWGGVSPEGTVVDAHHPQAGVQLTGQVVAMPSGRGSSSSTAVLAELVRSGRGPAALLLAECDTILVIGALVAAEMYGIELPVVELSPEALAGLSAGTLADVHAHTAPLDASVTLETS